MLRRVFTIATVILCATVHTSSALAKNEAAGVRKVTFRCEAGSYVASGRYVFESKEGFLYAYLRKKVYHEKNIPAAFQFNKAGNAVTAIYNDLVYTENGFEYDDYLVVKYGAVPSSQKCIKKNEIDCWINTKYLGPYRGCGTITTYNN